MATQNKSRKTTNSKDSDSVFVLKLVLFLVLGSLWVKVSKGQDLQIPLPIGFIFGLLLATHEHFRINRRIEFAVLVLAMFIGFWTPMGLYIGL